MATDTKSGDRSGFSDGLGMGMHISVEDATRLAKETVTAGNEATESISEIRPEGLLIARPGKYTFTNDVIWCPTRSGSVAILVTCSDVSIDFSNFCLTKSEKRCATTGSEITECVGVRVGSTRQTSALHHVSLCCGTVRGFDQYGVIAIGTDDVTINRIVIQDLPDLREGKKTLPSPPAQAQPRKHRRRQHVTAGILMSDCRRPHIAWSVCEMARGKHRGLHSAIQLQHCTEAAVKDVRVLKQRNDQGSCIGISAFACTGVDIARCHIGGVAAHAFVGGVATLGCTNVHMVGNYIASIVGNAGKAGGGDAYGIYMAACTGPCVVKACTVTHVGAPSLPSPLAATHRQNDAEALNDVDAHAMCATGVWVLRCKKVQFLGCTVSDVTSGTARGGYAAGFLDGDTQHVSFVHCSVNAVAAAGDTPGSGSWSGSSSSSSVGFGGIAHAAAPSVHTAYVACRVSRCSIGYSLATHEKYSLKGCTAQHVDQKKVPRTRTRTRTSTG